MSEPQRYPTIGCGCSLARSLASLQSFKGICSGIEKERMGERGRVALLTLRILISLKPFSRGRTNAILGWSVLQMQLCANSNGSYPNVRTTAMMMMTMQQPISSSVAVAVLSLFQSFPGGERESASERESKRESEGGRGRHLLATPSASFV